MLDQPRTGGGLYIDAFRVIAAAIANIFSNAISIRLTGTIDIFIIRVISILGLRSMSRNIERKKNSCKRKDNKKLMLHALTRFRAGISSGIISARPMEI